MLRRILFLIASLSLLVFVSQVLCATSFAQANPPLAPTNKKPEAPQTIAVTVSPESLDFGSQPVGSTSPVRTVVVTVAAGSDAPIKVSGSSNGDFQSPAAPCEFKGPGGCAFGMAFAPKQPGQSTGALIVTLTSGETALTKVVGLAGEGNKWTERSLGIFTRERGRAVGEMLLVVGLYMAGIILIRWHMIARPTRSLLQAAIESFRTHVETLKASPNATSIPGLEQIEKLLNKADGFAGDKRFSKMLWDYLLWNRGQELSAWNCLHEAEEQLVLVYPSEDSYKALVRAELEQAELDLRQVNSDISKGMSDRIKGILNPTPPAPPSTFETLKASLNEALGFLYDRTDTNFATLISWHNKTMWLIGCASLLIVSLGAALQHEVFFLVGATGGLLSRLSRSLEREDVPTDYGASWTTLFLSPVVGALAGWCGVLLIILGADLKIFGEALKINWSDSYSAVALGAALLLGTSERAFANVLTQLEDKVKAQKTGEKTTQPDKK